jgi:hypothetical protein
MELAADTDSDSHEKDSQVEENKIEAELQEEQEKASADDKSNWELQQSTGSRWAATDLLGMRKA